MSEQTSHLTRCDILLCEYPNRNICATTKMRMGHPRRAVKGVRSAACGTRPARLISRCSTGASCGLGAELSSLVPATARKPQNAAQLPNKDRHVRGHVTSR